MFKTVFLMLGEGCNFQCKYCLQHPILTEQLSSEINPDLIPYLKELSQKDTLMVMFYGGEPLLYWRNIVEIHQQLKNENMQFGIISNGSLLNDEMTQYIFDNQIGISVSQDGGNTEKFRGENVLENPQILAKIHRLNARVSAVVHASNMDIKSIYEYWWSKGIPVERTNIDLIMDTGLTDKELTEFDWAKWEILCSDFFDNVHKAIISGSTCVEMYIGNQLYQKMKSNLSLTTEEEFDKSCSSKCGVGIRTLNIDLQGNAYLCHNSSEKIGTIYDSYEKLVDSFSPFGQIAIEEECTNCSVRVLCNGGCVLVPKEARNRYYCKMNKIYYGAFINAILKAGSETNV